MRRNREVIAQYNAVLACRRVPLPRSAGVGLDWFDVPVRPPMECMPSMEPVVAPCEVVSPVACEAVVDSGCDDGGAPSEAAPLPAAQLVAEDDDGESSEYSDEEETEWMREDLEHVRCGREAGTRTSRIKHCDRMWLPRARAPIPASKAGLVITANVMVQGRTGARALAPYTTMKMVSKIPTAMWWTPVRKNYAVSLHRDIACPMALLCAPYGAVAHFVSGLAVGRPTRPELHSLLW